VKVRLEGVADAGGDSEANQRLATARADALKQYLVEHGVAAGRIETGMGTGRQVGVVVNPRD
jgi:outer membrane protein OmpA-like peptidoglycan-associated protein